MKTKTLIKTLESIALDNPEYLTGYATNESFDEWFNRVDADTLRESIETMREAAREAIQEVKAREIEIEALEKAALDAQVFIKSLLDVTPNEATDFLVNNGETVEGDLRAALHLNA